MQYGDTIAAISSASGPAARMILRISGPQAANIAMRFTGAKEAPAPASAKRVQLAFGDIGFWAWLYFFRSPRSYTGEDLIEFHIPGNPLLAKMLLEELLRAGARPAEAGEFTARAYFNGRLDLTQAEGVAATIAASNEQELAAARRLLSGELARRVEPIVETIAGTLALLEIGIDFSDEDVSFLAASELRARIESANAMLEALLSESTRFERLTHEPTVVLAGRPNAGKSTLLNVLAGHDRAVVSPVAGTTRDALSVEIALPRGLIRLIDVAGLEEASNNEDLVSPTVSIDAALQSRPNIEGDVIAAKMRDYAERALGEADFLIMVRDSTDARAPISLGRKPDLVVLTKADLGNRAWPSSLAFSSDMPDFGSEAQARRGEGNNKSAGVGTRGQSVTQIPVSALTGEGLPSLRDALESICFGTSDRASGLALSVRHVQSVTDARVALSRARAAQAAGPEYVAQELREALDSLGQITGRISPDDLLGAHLFGVLHREMIGWKVKTVRTTCPPSA